MKAGTIYTSLYPLKDEAGHVTRLVVYPIDITDRKKAESRVQESEAMLARAQQMAHVGHWEQNISSGKLRWSDETYRIFGLAPQEREVDVRFFIDRVHPDDRLSLKKAARDAAEKKTPYDEIYRIVRPDGTIRWVHSKGEATRDNDTGSILLFGTILDITERKQIEEALRLSEEAATAILNASQEIIFLIDTAGLVVAANVATAHGLGVEPHEMVGRCIFDFFPGDVCESRRTAGEEVIRTGRPIAFEDQRMGRYFDNVIYPIRNDTGQVTGLVIYAHDITERKRMEDNLRESEERFRLALEGGRLATWDWRVQTGEFVWNDNHYRMFGYVPGEVAAGLAAWSERLHPEDRDAMETQFRADVERGGQYTVQYRVLWPDDTVHWMESNCCHQHDAEGRPVRSYGVIAEITERKQMEEELRKSRDELERRVEERTEELQRAYHRLLSEIRQRHETEEQLHQTQKMEAVGNLAGGIAHDFNNMLAAIIGNAELALDDVEGPPRHNIKQILNASKRSRDLVRQILTFTRKNEGPRKIMHLTPLLKETVKLLRGSMPSTIRIRLAIRTDSDIILADPSNMQQVLMNLATNAAHAMEHGGTLAISLSETTFQEEDGLPDNYVQAGRYLKLTVTDTGTGMPNSVRQRIFEPFFTTKEQGQGTGMGLAVVFGIVKSHEGVITVASEPGKGSVFRIFLPVAGDTAKEEHVRNRMLPKGKERILVVDDEPSVVEMTSETLTRLGYKVTTAQSGPEGWIKFQHDPYQFDCVITDHVMPEITGMRLAEMMLEVRDDLPIILCTGYSEMVSAEKVKAAGISEFLMKPLMSKELVSILRRVLDMKKHT